jgi:DNA polymerase
LHLAVPFFTERFSVIRWSILTPDASVHWNPRERLLEYGPGVPHEHAPQEDELEILWKSYSGYIVNPARINPRAMKADNPVQYGSTRPELDMLPQFLSEADAQIEGMMAMQNEKIGAVPFVPDRHSVTVLKQAVQKCRGCDLYKFATQAVFGDGPAHAAMMLVGEQPGDEEDKRGEPFVGPAGRLLNEMLEEVGIERKQVYLTNAVKHFKFVERGKRRLHQPPRLSEIMACKPWLEAEFDAVKPRIVVCLGATAAKSVLGSKFALMKERGKVIESTSFKQVIATIHPSAVLRAPDDEMRHQLRAFLSHDLALAIRTALSRAS